MPRSRRQLGVGQRHGHLTIVARGRLNGTWRVRCYCGVEKDVQSGTLGTATFSCGCQQNIGKYRPGARFLGLTLVARLGRRWRMLCECGKEIIIEAANAGRQRSCGCHLRRATRERRAQIIGKRFGRLVVLNFQGTDERREARWLCVCDCGQQKSWVPMGSLKSGRTTSCGCAHEDASRRRILPENRSLTPAQRQRRYAQSDRGMAAKRRAQFRYARRRWASIRGDPGVSSSQWLFIQWAYEQRCAYCGRRRELTQDHVVPRSKGGRHSPDNIVPACWDCNYKKRARTLDVALQILKVADADGFVDKWSHVGNTAKECHDA